MSKSTDNDHDIIDVSPKSDNGTQWDSSADSTNTSNQNWLWNADVNSSSNTDTDLYNWGITSEYLKDTTSIGGWLSFFLVIVGLGGLMSAASILVTFKLDDYAGLWPWASIDIFIGLVSLFVAGYTIYSFVQRKPNAVFVAKLYVATVFCSNLLILLMEGGEDASATRMTKPILGLFWGVLWFTYLCVSKQVKDVIPKYFRRRKTFDYVLLVSIIVVPIVLFVIGIAQLLNQNAGDDEYGDGMVAQADTIYQWELNDDEYTDGLSIIKCPEGFQCQVQECALEDDEDQTVTFISLESELATITYASDYETDMSKSQFVTYWTNWKDQEASAFNEEILIDELRTIKGNPYHYRMTKYYNDSLELAWRFILLYDLNQNKVAVVSAYDGYPENEYGPDSYLRDFISNIRFEND